MPEPRYRIIFEGQPLSTTSVQTLQDNLVQLFNITPEQAAAMLQKGPHVLKKNLTEAQTAKYLATLQQAGAAAHKEAEPTPSPEITEPSAPTPAPQWESAGETATNPYAPPQARVTDTATEEYGELNPWTVQGRIGRLRSLAWIMVSLLAGGGTGGIFAALVVLMPNSVLLLSIPLLLACLFMLLCFIRIFAQRLHDIGLSAWYILICCIPFIGTLFTLVLAFWPGDEEENEYGPPPPPNTRSVKILAGLHIFLFIFGLLVGITTSPHW